MIRRFSRHQKAVVDRDDYMTEIKTVFYPTELDKIGYRIACPVLISGIKCSQR